MGCLCHGKLDLLDQRGHIAPEYKPENAYGSHEHGTRGIGRMYREYAKKFRLVPVVKQPKHSRTN